MSIIEVYILTPEFVEESFNSPGKLAVPIGIPTRKPKAKLETHRVVTETKIWNCSISFKHLKTFSCFLISNAFVLFLSEETFHV